MQGQLNELIENLSNPDESIRREAAEQLGYLRTDEAVDPLVHLLSDEDRSVTEEAADALISIGSTTVAERLLPLLDTEKAVLRNDAAEILTRLGDNAIPALCEALHNVDKDVRQFAIDSIERIGSKEVLPLVIEALNDENVNIASVAAEVLGRLGSDANVKDLLAHLKHENEWFVGACIRALGQIGSDSAMAAVLPFLESKSSMLKLSAIKGLGKSARKYAVDPLLQVLETDGDVFGDETIMALHSIQTHPRNADYELYISAHSLPALIKVVYADNLNTRLCAIDLLGCIRHKLDIQVLVDLFSDEEREIRRKAMQVLIDLKTDNIQPVLDLLDSTTASMEAKACALDILGSQANPQGLHYIKQYLDSDDIILQRVALKALYRPIDGEILEKLRQRLNSPILDIRLFSLKAIERLRLNELIEDVIGLVHDEEPEIQDAADEVIVNIASKNENQLVYPFLNSFDQEERRLAFRYFSDHTNTDLVPRLKDGLKDEDSEIRIISIKALANLIPHEAHTCLEPCFEDADERVVITAIQIFGELARPACLEFLEKFLKQTDNQRFIYECLMAIGKINGPTSQQIIEPYLEHEEIYPKLAAIEAMGILRTEQAHNKLKAMLQSEDDPEVLDTLEYVLESV